MLYHFLKFWYRQGMRFFYRHVSISDWGFLNREGPLMLAVNHPDSFADAMFFATFMKEPVYFMTRGDVFKKPLIRKILQGLKMIPIFRIRDGKDKLALNQESFDVVIEVFKKGGIVLIFVEGFCEYQTELQLPLKKGAPRIIVDCWKQEVPVRIAPVWLKYDSFFDFGKILDVRVGSVFGKEIVSSIPNEAAQVMLINKQMETTLLELSAARSTYKPLDRAIRNILLPFAMLAKLVHAPFYMPIQRMVSKKSQNTTHYDSVMAAALILTYPLYLVLVTGVLLVIFHSAFAWLVFVVFPLLAKTYLYWKK